MGLKKLLEKKKSVIIKDWFEAVASSYAPDTADFFKRQKDPFANPVGSTIYDGLNKLFDELLLQMNHEEIKSCLDPLIRIRAVQDFSPSEATTFILSLKKVILTTLKKELRDVQILKEFLQFESKIDTLSLIAFDIYVECREKIYELKVTTERNKIYSAFARAGLIDDAPENAFNLKAL
jgi:RsbRD-like negative regulator of sigma factor